MKLHSRANKWGAAWTFWAFLFAWIETKALKSGDKEATLSAHLRWVFGYIYDRRPSTLTRQAAGVALWFWLLKHLAAPAYRKIVDVSESTD